MYPPPPQQPAQEPGQRPDSSAWQSPPSPPTGPPVVPETDTPAASPHAPWAWPAHAPLPPAGPGGYGPFGAPGTPGGHAPSPGRPARRGRRLVFVALLAVALVAAYITVTAVSGDDASSGGHDGGEEGGRGVTAEAGPPIAPHRSTPMPEDRDIGAVTVALRALDPCKLLDTSLVAGSPVTIPEGAHSCLLVADRDYEVVADALTARVGVLSHHISRYDEKPITLGGAKVYQHAEGQFPCGYVVPVSAVRGIEFGARPGAGVDEDPNGELCAVLRDVAERAVAELRDPDALALGAAGDPVSGRPYAAWDGCTLLSVALGREEAKKYRAYQPDGLNDPFAGCLTHVQDSADLGPTLEVVYGAAPTVTLGEVKAVAVGGKTVRMEFESREGRCTATWDDGASGVENVRLERVLVTVQHTDCESTRRLAESVIRLSAQRPPTAGIQPQRPLLFGPKDNDLATKGACVDLLVDYMPEDCEPYQPIEVPRGVEQIMAAVTKNRNVQCALAKEAIDAAFGQRFTPVTWANSCYFVEPSHRLHIRVYVNPHKPAAEFDEPSSSPAHMEIAGLPAFSYTDVFGYNLYLAPTGDLADLGYVSLLLRAAPERGSYGSQDAVPRPAAADVERAVAAMTEVAAEHFA